MNANADEDVQATEFTSADLSRLLFEARECIEMWADVVESRMGVPDTYTRGVVARLDAYRAHRGWSEHGFGNEPNDTMETLRLALLSERRRWQDLCEYTVERQDSDLSKAMDRATAAYAKRAVSGSDA